MDDGIALSTAENLFSRLKEKNIEVIMGETDFEYCLCQIKEEDFIIILDAVDQHLPPGTAVVIPFQQINSYTRHCYSQHQPNLIKLLNIYKKGIQGFIVGIQIEKIEFSFCLSESLQRKLNEICEEVYHLILSTMEGIHYA